MSGGSPEQGLLSAACAQMENHYDLPFGTACGMTDSKFPDYQGGADYFPQHISNEMDAKVRNRFPIFLSPEAMGRR